MFQTVNVDNQFLMEKQTEKGQENTPWNTQNKHSVKTYDAAHQRQYIVENALCTVGVE